MQTFRFQVAQSNCFKALPLNEFELKKYSIYIIDYDWNYLFANRYAIESLGGINPVGKHVQTIWKEREEVNFEPIFNMLKHSVTQRKPLELKSRSPLTKKNIEILGHPLDDCYCFSIQEMPDKESLLQELKSLLNRKKP